MRGKYLEIGDGAIARGFSKGAYYVGKLAWAKGMDNMFTLMKHVRDCLVLSCLVLSCLVLSELVLSEDGLIVYVVSLEL